MSNKNVTFLEYAFLYSNRFLTIMKCKLTGVTWKKSPTECPMEYRCNKRGVSSLEFDS